MQMEALLEEIDGAAAMVDALGLRVRSFYMGGGTPTTLTAGQMERLLERLHSRFRLDSAVESTVEAGRPDTITAEKLEALEEIRRIYEKILEDRQCVSLRTLAVTGKDLIEAGMEPGKEIGRTLEKLLQIVLEDPEENSREKLMEYVKGMTS